MARFLIAAFQGFVLQLEWDPGTPVEPYVKVLDALLERWLPQAPVTASGVGDLASPVQARVQGERQVPWLRRR